MSLSIDDYVLRERWDILWYATTSKNKIESLFFYRADLFRSRTDNIS